MNRLMSDVWTGLRTGPARAALAFLSLMLGLFAVTLLLATLDALNGQAKHLVRHFGAGSVVLKPPAAADAAWTRAHVEAFRANLGEAAWVSGARMRPPPPGWDVPVMAADDEWARARGWRFIEGRALDRLDLRRGQRHAVAPADLCRSRNWQTGQVILLGREPYRLVGIFDAGGTSIPSLPEQAVVVPHTADGLETGTAEEAQRVEAVLFRAKPGIAPEALQRRIRALLNQTPGGGEGVEWITPKTLLAGIRRWQRTVFWTAGAGGALGLLMGAVTLAGMLLTGVRERIPEIGLRRTLGARRRDIAGLFVAEALVLTGGAALAGLAAAEVVLRGLGGRFPLPYQFDSGVRLAPLALALVLALLCSTGPAWRAARLPPAEALRNE